MGTSDKNQKGVTRRGFVKSVAATIGATGLAATGGAAVLLPGEAEAKVPGIPAKWDYQADVVIVGYGGAGIAAAITATDAGAKVIVLEKDTLPRGGNTGCSGGNLCIGNTEEGALEYTKSMCWGTVPDEDLIRTTVLASRAFIGWIEKLGGKIVYSKRDAAYKSIPGGEAFSGPKMQANIEDGGGPGDGYALYQFFLKIATAKGIKPMLGTPAKDLIQNPLTKEIVGVRAVKEGKEITVKANKAVILACGGYENNETIRKNFAPHPHSGYVTFYGTPLNTGDGFLMAQRAGARIWHMNKKECHSFGCVAASKEVGAGVVMGPAYGFPNSNAQSGIIVNRDGKRFMNEYFDGGHTDRHRAYDEFEHQHKPVDDSEYSDYRNLPMYWVFDDATMKSRPFAIASRWVGKHKIYTWSPDNQAELAKGWIIKADTLQELAKKIVVKDFFGRVVGMDPAGLEATVAKYNQYGAAGKDPDFGRRPSTLKPLSKPPFYAIEICECQTNTQGGPEHDKFARTLNVDGKPIPRLYTPGELGSLYGALYNGGGNLPEAYSFGRIAAEHALALKPWK